MVKFCHCKMWVKFGLTVVVVASIAMFTAVNQTGDEINVFGWKIDLKQLKSLINVEEVVEVKKDEQEGLKKDLNDVKDTKQEKMMSEEEKDAERLEKERQESEKRFQLEKAENERIVAETKEKFRKEEERQVKEGAEAEKKFKERERKAKLEKEWLEKDKQESDELEKERLKKLQNERKKKELEEKQLKEKKELEWKQKLEHDRKHKERMDNEIRLLKKQDEEKHAREIAATTDEEKEQKQKALEEEVDNERAETIKAQGETYRDIPGSPVSHEPMHLAVVACGDRLEETLIMIKSALIFSQAMLHVHIFADKDLQPQFKKSLDQLPSDVQNRFQYHIRDIQFPTGYKDNEWRTVFKMCATQRLFIPDILPAVHQLLYVDTDILFMRPMEDVWDFFHQFNSTQIAAVSWEHEDGSAGWYNRFARHPYFYPFGINSGVMLMDLPALRAHKWTTLMKSYYDEYKLRITWGDQDLINIFFHYYPEKLYIFSCAYNYRPDHCMYMQNCRPAAEHGISVIHGNRGTLHNEKQVTFRAIYTAFKQYTWGDALKEGLLKVMVNYVENCYDGKDRCYSVRQIFTKQIQKSVENMEKSPGIS